MVDERGYEERAKDAGRRLPLRLLTRQGKSRGDGRPRFGPSERCAPPVPRGRARDPRPILLGELHHRRVHRAARGCAWHHPHRARRAGGTNPREGHIASPPRSDARGKMSETARALLEARQGHAKAPERKKFFPHRAGRPRARDFRVRGEARARVLLEWCFFARK